MSSLGISFPLEMMFGMSLADVVVPKECKRAKRKEIGKV